MTTQIALPTGSYVNRDPRSSCKRLVGCFSEIQPQTAPPDSKSEVPPISIRRAFGITALGTITIPQNTFTILAGIGDANINIGYGNATADGTFGSFSGSSTIGTLKNAQVYAPSQPLQANEFDLTLVGASTFPPPNAFTSVTVQLANGQSVTLLASAATYGTGGTAESTWTWTNPLIGANKWLVGSSYTVTLTFPGSDSNAPVSPLPVRGIHTMAGVTYAVIGPTLYTMDAAGDLTSLATGIFGSSFVRMADNTACLVILIPGTAIAYTYSLGGGFQPLLDSGFTSFGAIDVGFCDSFIVFLALNGREFFNDDGQNVSGQGQITFTSGSVFPREFGTDLFVGMGIDHREVVLFGALTTEGYLNAGNAVGSPFSSAPSSFMEIGSHPLAAYCVAKQDQALFFVANDLTVRRRSGQTPTRVSNSGIESILMTANLTGSYALTPSAGGHPMYAIVIPADQRTLVYDCLTTEWFELESAQVGYWRPLCWYNAFGKQLVGDSVSSSIGYLDVTSYTEFGLPLTASFTTQSVFDNHNRIIHRRIELVITAGEAPDLETDPEVTLWVSDDSGSTWYARETYGLGFRGQRQMRVYWTNLGQSRDRVYRFTISDPTPAFTVAILAELDGGRW